MDESKIKDIINTCNIIQGTAVAVGEQLRDCIIDLGNKISQDNVGTRSNKDGAYNKLIDGTDVIQETKDISELIMEALNTAIK